MSFELVIFTGVVLLVAVGAFVAGRKTSPEKTRAASIQEELDATQDELQRVRGQINGHFEQSGRLFGRLAEDYRALYEHFSDTAVALGFTENEAASLLELSDPRLLSDGDSGGAALRRGSHEPREHRDGSFPGPRPTASSDTPRPPTPDTDLESWEEEPAPDALRAREAKG